MQVEIRTAINKNGRNERKSHRDKKHCNMQQSGGVIETKRGRKVVQEVQKSVNCTLHYTGGKRQQNFVEILASQSVLDCCQYICFFYGT